MAERMEQAADLRQIFRRVIDRKERRRREESVERLERDHPILGPIVAPFANLVLFDEDNRNFLKGHSGESAVARMLRRLPSPWCYLNNVVFERRPGEYMQIDHIAVGPAGVAVLETKRWRGAIQGHRDIWKVKSARGWSRLQSSPTRQAVWHADAVERHLRSLGFTVRVAAALVFVEPGWLRHQDCSCPVFSDVGSLRSHLLSADGSPPLALEQCRAIAEALAQTFRLEEARAPVAPRGAPAAAPAAVDASRATERQRRYVAQLLGAAGLRPAGDRLEALTRAQAQAVIDRLRFHRDVALPPGLVEDD